MQNESTTNLDILGMELATKEKLGINKITLNNIEKNFINFSLRQRKHQDCFVNWILYIISYKKITCDYIS